MMTATDPGTFHHHQLRTHAGHDQALLAGGVREGKPKGFECGFIDRMIEIQWDRYQELRRIFGCVGGIYLKHVAMLKGKHSQHVSTKKMVVTPVQTNPSESLNKRFTHWKWCGKANAICPWKSYAPTGVHGFHQIAPAIWCHHSLVSWDSEAWKCWIILIWMTSFQATFF